jgi:DNA modification methylase
MVVFLERVNKILCGDALEILKGLPSKFVDMAMTSPPYWGLRNYGGETCKIWDGDIGCKHEWVESSVNYSQPHHGIGSKTMGIPCVTREALNKPNPKSAFCHKCRAWYGQLGLEPLPDMYVKHLLQIFRELKRILKPTGSFYLNMGDTYAGSRCGSHDYRTDKCKNFTGREQYNNKYNKPAPQASAQIPRKSLCMIPERVALAMVSDGWILRNKIIWHKPNPMPSSVKDRLGNTWEYLFHFVKRQKYYYNLDAIREPHKTASLERTKRKWNGHREPGASWQGMDISKMCHLNGKNPGDIFKIATKAFPEAHFAVYPEKLCEAPIKAACPEHVCKKCGQPKRQVLKTKPNPNAFNIRVRDVKKGRIKFEDRKASEIEVKQYQEKKYQSRPREVVIAKGCKCNSGFKSGIVLDPFCGAGTTCLVAKKLERRFIGIDIRETYCRMARKRLAKGH